MTIFSEIHHSAATQVLYNTAERVVKAGYDTDSNLTMYMNGFTKDSLVGAKLYFGYNDSNLYRNVTVDFVGR